MRNKVSSHCCIQRIEYFELGCHVAVLVEKWRSPIQVRLLTSAETHCHLNSYLVLSLSSYFGAFFASGRPLLLRDRLIMVVFGLALALGSGIDLVRSLLSPQQPVSATVVSDIVETAKAANSVTRSKTGYTIGDAPIQSPNDKRTCRIIRLENGLRAIIVSDPFVHMVSSSKEKASSIRLHTSLLWRLLGLLKMHEPLTLSVSGAESTQWSRGRG